MPRTFIHCHDCPECDFDTKEEKLFHNHVMENHLTCSECDFDNKEENLFKHHATDNHPMSSEFLKCHLYFSNV